MTQSAPGHGNPMPQGRLRRSRRMPPIAIQSPERERRGRVLCNNHRSLTLPALIAMLGQSPKRERREPTGLQNGKLGTSNRAAACNASASHGSPSPPRPLTLPALTAMSSQSPERERRELTGVRNATLETSDRAAACNASASHGSPSPHRSLTPPALTVMSGQSPERKRREPTGLRNGKLGTSNRDAACSASASHGSPSPDRSLTLPALTPLLDTLTLAAPAGVGASSMLARAAHLPPSRRRPPLEDTR